MPDSRGQGCLFWLLPLALLGCATEAQPEIDLEAEAQVIRGLDAALSKAAQDGDADAFGSFFAEDATQLPPGAPPLRGRDAIRGAVAGLLGAGADLRFETLEVKVSASGDMAFSRGMWYLNLETTEGPAEDRGSFIEVWEKNEGEWSITNDIFNSDLPGG